MVRTACPVRSTLLALSRLFWSLVLVAVLTRPAVSATFTVTSAADSGAGSLRQAILNSNAATGQANQISFASSLAGQTINLASALPAFSTDCTVTESAPDSISISGQGTVSVFSVNSGVTLTLTGVSIEHASASQGSAINSNGTLNLNNCELLDNTASDNGGAIYCNGTTTIQSGEFSSNSSTGGNGGCIYADASAVVTMNSVFLDSNTSFATGGALYVALGASVAMTSCTFAGSGGNSAPFGGAIENQGTINAQSCTFTNNQATSVGGAIDDESTMTMSACALNSNVCQADGGAVYVGVNSRLNMSACTFTSNKCSAGGELAGQGAGISVSGTVTLSDCTFTHNETVYGGALFLNGPSGPVSLTHCTLTSNAATTGGGAIGTVPTSGALSLVACTLNRNVSSYGGALYNSGSAVTMTNCTLSGNSGESIGGGIYTVNSTASTTLTFDTIATNAAPYAGGIAGTDEAKLTLIDCIVASNTGTAPDVDGDHTVVITDDGGNVIGVTGTNPADSKFTAASTQKGTSASPLNPRLAPLANNGGSTLTMALQTGSPAIASGVPVAGVTTDQRGVTRASNKPCSGSYEFTPLSIAPTGLAFGNQVQSTSSSPQSVTINNPGDETFQIGHVVSGVNASDFQVVGPTSLGPGQSAALSITFTPQGIGARIATLTIDYKTSLGVNVTQLIALAGNGTSSNTGNPDFILSANGSFSAVLPPGGGATLPFTLTPQNGYNQPIVFSASGLPSGATATFSPAGVTPDGAPINVSVTITTTAPARAAFLGAGITAAAVLFLLPLGRRRRQPFLGVCVMMVIGLLAGCGGSGASTPSGTPASSTSSVQSGTPPGTSQVIITATSANGTVAKSLTLNLEVTQP